MKKLLLIPIIFIISCMADTGVVNENIVYRYRYIYGIAEIDNINGIRLDTNRVGKACFKAGTDINSKIIIYAQGINPVNSLNRNARLAVTDIELILYNISGPEIPKKILRDSITIGFDKSVTVESNIISQNDPIISKIGLNDEYIYKLMIVVKANEISSLDGFEPGYFSAVWQEIKIVGNNKSCS